MSLNSGEHKLLHSVGVKQMIVDFIGAPGAGKSTLKHTVVDFFNRRGICANLVKQAGKESAKKTFPGQIITKIFPESLHAPILWRMYYPRTVVSRIPFVLRHRQLIQLIVQTQSQRPKEAELQRRRVIPRFMEMIGFYEYLVQHYKPEDVLVFDEGFIHRVILLFTSEVEVPEPETIHRYIDLIPKSDLLVYTYAPPEVCKKRILERGLWGWSHDKTDCQIERFIDNAILAVEMAVDYVIRKDWPLVIIDNQNDGSLEAEHALRKSLSILYPERKQSTAPVGVGVYQR